MTLPGQTFMEEYALVTRLHAVKQAHEEAKQKLAELTKAFEDREEVKELRQLTKQLSTQVQDLDADVRKAALVTYRAGGTPHPAVEIRQMVTLAYDQGKAIDWAIETNKNMLKLDTRAFEKLARAVRESMPFEFVEYSFTPTPFLKADLSEWGEAEDGNEEG